MLDNDPPPGTQVRFTREIRKARANDFANRSRTRRYLADTILSGQPTNSRLSLMESGIGCSDVILKRP